MWAVLINRYWQVSIFKDTPANTPYSLLLLALTALFLFFLIVLQWMIADVKQEFVLSTSLLEGATLLASYGVYTSALLSAFRLPRRIVQTLTCLLAGNIIVHLFAFPLLLVTPWLIESITIQPIALLVGIVYLILTLILTVWQFMITVHIYKSALAIDYLPAVLASFGLLASTILIVSFWR